MFAHILFWIQIAHFHFAEFIDFTICISLFFGFLWTAKPNLYSFIHSDGIILASESAGDEPSYHLKGERQFLIGLCFDFNI